MAGPALVSERSRRSESARAERREEILAAARRVFAARGFRGTTIADIAEDAGVALGTIYLYFKSKEDVFAALNGQLGELIAAAMYDAPAGQSLAETVRTRVANVFDACDRNRDLVRLVVLNSDQESLTMKRLRAAEAEREAPMVRQLARGMASGVIRQGDPAIMTNLTRGLVSIAVYQAFVLADGKDAETYRDECARMIISYMQTGPDGSSASTDV